MSDVRNSKTLVVEEKAMIKKTIAQLRQSQGNEPATRQVILCFIRERMRAGWSLEKTIGALALGPDSVLRRACFSELEARRLMEFLKACTMLDLLDFSDEA
ncbi:MAG: hypothetical protein KIS67_23220 [Verrucomicrobiae bacterium]|nr:hypothetical protein [Verrucomicrobiae bacterium]